MATIGKQNTVEQNNRIIAEYFGIKAKKKLFYWILYNEKNGHKIIDGWTEQGAWNNFLRQYPFSSSWKWVMEAIRRINAEEEGKVKIEFNKEQNNKGKWLTSTTIEDVIILAEDPLLSIFMALVGYCQKHKSNK